MPELAERICMMSLLRVLTGYYFEKVIFPIRFRKKKRNRGEEEGGMEESPRKCPPFWIEPGSKLEGVEGRGAKLAFVFSYEDKGNIFLYSS
jgi:hypothetical protein